MTGGSVATMAREGVKIGTNAHQADDVRPLWQFPVKDKSQAEQLSQDCRDV